MIFFRKLYTWCSFLFLLIGSYSFGLERALTDLTRSLRALEQTLSTRVSPRVVSKKLDLNYKGLLDDIKLYKTTNINWHAGDVYEHSAWMALCVEQWFDEDVFWIHGLSRENDEKVMAIASFLHDIGKAGDHAFRFKAKSNHPRVGFEYLIGKRNYRLRDNSIFDLKEYLQQFGLTEEEQAIIALLVGIHYDFGKQVMGKLHRDSSSIRKGQAFKFYIEGLQRLAREAGLQTIDERLMIMSMIINAADIRATQPVTYKSKLFDLPYPIMSVHRGADKYKEYRFAIKGKIIRKNLLDYFRQRY